jgi:hypothetical protein
VSITFTFDIISPIIVVLVRLGRPLHQRPVRIRWGLHACWSGCGTSPRATLATYTRSCGGWTAEAGPFETNGKSIAQMVQLRCGVLVENCPLSQGARAARTAMPAELAA